MAYEFKLPDIGEGIHEAEIVEWLVKVGDKVKQDQDIVKIETEKAMATLPIPKSGKVLKLHFKPGDTVKVGQTLISIETGEKEEGKKAVAVVGFLEEAPEEVTKKGTKKTVKREAKAMVAALPAVRELARELDVDISTVGGTGPGGRITEDDVRSAAGKGKAEAKPQEVISEKPEMKKVRKYDMWGYTDRIPIKGVRKVIAENLTRATSTAAYVTVMNEADVSFLWDFREKEKEKGKRKKAHVTFLPYIIKACLDALKENPTFNAAVDEGTQELVVKKYHNYGIAVDTPDGLIVPVVKGVDLKDVVKLSIEIEDLADKAMKRTLDLAELHGSSFTITNLGVIGGKFATPIPNFPDVSILLTGKIHDAPVVKDGNIIVRKMLPLSLTFDHRVNDGAGAQRLLNRIIQLLEDESWLKKLEI